MDHKLIEKLNNAHADLESDLRLYGSLFAMEEKGSIFSVENLREEIENHLVNVLDIDLEEVEEEEDSLQDGIVSAFQQAHKELKVYMAMDRNAHELMNVGASEEELEGYRSFQKRLESVIFDRYGVDNNELEVVEETENE